MTNHTFQHARITLVVLTAALLGVPVVASAQPLPGPGGPPAAGAATLRLTVNDAVDLALKASHRVGEAEAREDAAKAGIESRQAAGKPVVSLLAGYLRTNHVQEFAIARPGSTPLVVYPDVPDNWRTRADAQWPIYTSGRVQALAKAAELEQQATGKDVAAARVDVRLDATRAYWSLVMSRAVVSVTEDALALVEAHLHDVKALRAAGIAAPNDVLTAEARRSRQQVLVIEARNARDVAEADLRRVTGIGADVRIDPIGILEAPPREFAAFDSLLEDAKRARPERQALQLRAGALGEQRKAVAAGTKPTMAIGAGFDYSRPNTRIFPRAGDWNDSWDVGFNVSWPVFDGGRTKADTAQVTASARAVVQRLAEFDTQLTFDVRQRQLDLAAGVASIRAAQEEVASAAEARRVVAERYKAGLASNTDVLDAQQELLVAKLTLTQSQASVRLAEARLDRTLGR